MALVSLKGLPPARPDEPGSGCSRTRTITTRRGQNHGSSENQRQERPEVGRRQAQGPRGRTAVSLARRASILLKHVSDPTRLQVILILSDGERHVGALCAQLSQSQPAVSHHLALLRHGGIIAPRRQGKNNFYSLTDTGTDLAKVVKNLIA